MHKRIICIFLAGICFYWSQAQSSFLDSLRQQIVSARTDSERILYRLDYGIQLSKSDMDKGIAEMHDADRVSIEKKMPYVHAAAVHLLASLYYEAGNYINTIAINEEAEKLFAALPDNVFKTHHLASAYNDMGASYSLINDMENAQVFYVKSAEKLAAMHDTANLIVSYFNVAFIYIDMQEWRTALSYFEKSMQLVRLKQNFKTYDAIVQLYARAAAMHFRLGEIAAGKERLQDAAVLLPRSGSDIAYIYYYNGSGEAYYAMRRYIEALTAFRTAYVYGLDWHDPYYLVDNSWEIGRTFLALGKTDSAEHYLRDALDTARRYNYLPKIRFIMNDWCEYYAQTGHFEKAYRLRTDLQHFTDSLIGVQNHNRILLFDARYNSQQKENQIQQLRQDKAIQDLTIKQTNILNYALIVGALILLALSIMSYRNYRQRQRLQQQRITELETEKQLAATEAVLKGEERERSRLAKDLHDGLGGVLSGIKHSFQSIRYGLVINAESQQMMDRNIEMIDHSIKEMRRIAHNMMPEALVKFGLDAALRDFCQEMDRSGALRMTYLSIGMEGAQVEQSAAIAMYRIVQELINNTIKHAQASQGIVQLSREESIITLTVEDDGKGFDIRELGNSGGIGWANVRSRVDFLKGKMDIKSTPGKGTSILIEIRQNSVP